MHRLMRKVGMPRYLLTGGYHGQSFHNTCCWPGFELIEKPQASFKPTTWNARRVKENELYWLLKGQLGPTWQSTKGFGEGKVLRLWRRNGLEE